MLCNGLCVALNVRRKEIASSPFLSELNRELSLSLPVFVSSVCPTHSGVVETAVSGVGGHISLLVCYGIGPVGSSHASQHQLAVMLELRDWLQVDLQLILTHHHCWIILLSAEPC